MLVGLSGGPDSVCLLHVLNLLREELNLRLHALYVDHGLRPEETPAEVAFSENLCEGLTIPFVAKAVEVKSYAQEQAMNIQEAARELRYRVFDAVFAETGSDRLALGHNADDQIETFFMRFLRGAGPKGLSGIPPVRARIIRPLIEIERREIQEFLDELGAGYLIDSSNLKEKYLRNRLRLLVVPELRKTNPNITGTVARTMDILREEEKYFDLIVTKTLMKLICKKTDLRIDLFLMPLEAMDTVILRRVLRRAVDETKGLRGMAFLHIEEIIGLIRRGRPGDRLHLPKGLRVIKNYSTLEMTSESLVRMGTVVLRLPGEAVLRDVGAVITGSIEDEVEGYGDGKTRAVFDADKTGTGLTVRARERGDLFYPLGLGKRKKLQDFFVDEKVPRDERDAVALVVSGSDIVWVAGYRGDDRFKVTGETKNFLKLEYRKTR